MITKIITFDPGGTTGIAVATIDSNVEVPKFEVEQLGPQQHHVELEDFLEHNLAHADRKFVVYETFDYRNTSRSGLVLDSREYIGVITLWCKRRGVALYKQTPAQAKGFVSDNILKELNLYSKAFRHANDAMRHLIYFIVNNDDFRFKALDYELAIRSQLLDLGFK